MCNHNRDHFLKLGDIATSKKFEKYANDSKKDLSMLKIRWRNGDTLPPCRTETRTFSIVMSNTEVGLNELTVDVVQAFDIPGKPEIDTYVNVELAFPAVRWFSFVLANLKLTFHSFQDKPQVQRTKTVYNTINPEYRETFKFNIDRKSRSLSRIFKRNALKLDVYSKGYVIGGHNGGQCRDKTLKYLCFPFRGFLRSDVLLGTVQVKLADLDTKCTLHDVHPLVAGRKATNSRLEVIVKLREPLLAKQIEEIKEKWIVFD